MTRAYDRAGRVVWGSLVGGAATLLALARSVAPAREGMGTHVALGLPPCGFLLWFDLPCPACGLTTAFAHLARLELGPALRAHPLGFPLFALALALVPWGLFSALRGASVPGSLARIEGARWAQWLALSVLVTWLARLLALASLSLR